MRYVPLLVVGFVLGAVAITGAMGDKNSLWPKLGALVFPANNQALAGASCDLPSKASHPDIYFVSCGGFY